MPRERALNAAVTGHLFNQLPVPERPRIRAEIERCIEELEKAGGEANDGALVRCTLYSAIAEGADRYAADAALTRGWRLVAPLPFDPDRYEQDFVEQESKQHYRRLLWSARRVTPVTKEDMDESGGGDAAPYAAVGRAIIERADVLLCVWGGKPPKGPGGTSEVAALMLEKGGLVLWISPRPEPTRLVGPAPLPRAGSFRRKLHEALSQRFERVVRPPEMRVA